MARIITRKRPRKDGTSVWEYRFEIASVDGKRQWISKSGFARKSDAKKAGDTAFLAYKDALQRGLQGTLSGLRQELEL